MARTDKSIQSGFLGLVAISLYCLWKSPRRFNGLLVVALLLVILFSIAPGGYWDEMETIKDGKESRTAEHRLYLWKVGWWMFLDNPLWGVGPGSVIYAIPKYEPPGGFYGRYQGFRVLHSTPVTLLSEMGIPGVVVFALLIYGLFQPVREVLMQAPSLGGGQERHATHIQFPRFSALGFEGGLIGFLAAGAFVSMLYYPQFWVMTGIMIAIRQICKNSVSHL